MHHSFHEHAERFGPTVLPLPHQQPAVNGRGRIATGVITMTARQLHLLHQRRMPRMLAGDFRTARANAMRPKRWKRSQYAKHKFRCRVDRANPIAFPAAHNLDGNPNKGATRSKIIGLPHNWSQPLRMEMWVFPRSIQPAYYFVCPGHRTAAVECGNGRGRGREARGEEKRNTSRQRTGASPSHYAGFSRKHGIMATVSTAETGASAAAAATTLGDARLPPPSTCKTGRKDPSDGKCPQRCLKLMMVQCTEEEFRDAELAQLWIDNLPPQFASVQRPMIARLIERYGLLFQPRVLLCPRCLGRKLNSKGGGVKYGNNPETVRQRWRRRNHKPDTTIHDRDNLLTTAFPLSHRTKRELAYMRYRRGEDDMNFDGANIDRGDWQAALARQRAERRRESQRRHYRRNAKRINQMTVERRRGKRMKQG